MRNHRDVAGMVMLLKMKENNHAAAEGQLMVGCVLAHDGHCDGPAEAMPALDTGWSLVCTRAHMRVCNVSICCGKC